MSMLLKIAHTGFDAEQARPDIPTLSLSNQNILLPRSFFMSVVIPGPIFS